MIAKDALQELTIALNMFEKMGNHPSTRPALVSPTLRQCSSGAEEGQYAAIPQETLRDSTTTVYVNPYEAIKYFRAKWWGFSDDSNQYVQPEQHGYSWKH